MLEAPLMLETFATIIILVRQPHARCVLPVTYISGSLLRLWQATLG